MLPCLRPELSVELHPHACTVSRTSWRACFGRSGPEPLASGSGRGARALSMALENLRQAEPDAGRTASHALPHPPVRLTVGDEFVDYLLIRGATLARSCAESARRRAQHRFADLLGHEASVVAVTPLPDSADWLAAALDREEFDTWRAVFDEQGLRLAHVHPALVEDLRTLAPRVREPDAVLALVRDEGVMLLRLAGHALTHLQWTAVHPDEAALVDLRLCRFARDTAPGATPGHTIVYLHARSRALCRYVLEPPLPQGPPPTPWAVPLPEAA